MDKNERKSYITELAKEASEMLGVELLSIVSSPLAGDYYVATFWYERAPYAATIYLFASGENYRQDSVKVIKSIMLRTMTGRETLSRLVLAHLELEASKG